MVIGMGGGGNLPISISLVSEDDTVMIEMIVGTTSSVSDASALNNVYGQ